jgi:alkylation response protein AidB-like acyl-CoA dehydrogenase
MSPHKNNFALEANKAKLREFIESGAQLCLTKAKPEHDLPSFHWEFDTGQNAPDFKLLQSEYFEAARDMLKSGELKLGDPKEYMGKGFTRLSL